MIEKHEIIGTCPIGRLVKITRIDRFGFFAGSEIVKQRTKAWKAFTWAEIPVELWSMYRPYFQKTAEEYE